MLKRNKRKIILSSLVVLLPILFGVIMWNKLPDIMTTHWGADNRADGFSGKAFAVFGLPLILLALHFVCLLVTLLDKKQQNQNSKALGIAFWIVPILSLFASTITYCAAFGKEFGHESLLPALLGLMFLFMGNFMPKIKQNKTLGIKIYWALHNEENWNKTHRFAAKLWVIGGIVLLGSVFLPFTAMTRVVLFVLVIAVLGPMIYSYCIFRQHQKQGITYRTAPKGTKERLSSVASVVLGTVLLVGVAVVLFSGNIEVNCTDTSLAIHATYWTDSSVSYAEVDTVTYRKDLELGSRANGFGSPKLSLGIFRNEEFGTYTLYAYTAAKEYVVLTAGEKTLVIGMQDAKDTQAIYDAVLSQKAK